MRITRTGLVVAAFVGVFAAVRPGAGAGRAASMADLPGAVGSFSSPQASLATAEVAATVGADEYVYRIYQGAGAAVEMDVSYYSDPRVGRVMHSPLNCLPGTGWRISDPKTLTLGRDWNVRTLIAQRGETHLALMYWYQTPRRVTGSELGSRMNLLVDGLTTGRRDTALVRLVAPVGVSPTDATETLATFARQFIPQIAARFL